MIMRMFDDENLDDDFFEDSVAQHDDSHPGQMKILIDNAHTSQSAPSNGTPRRYRARLPGAGKSPDQN